MSTSLTRLRPVHSREDRRRTSITAPHQAERTGRGADVVRCASSGPPPAGPRRDTPPRSAPWPSCAVRATSGWRCLRLAEWPTSTIPHSPSGPSRLIHTASLSFSKVRAYRFVVTRQVCVSNGDGVRNTCWNSHSIVRPAGSISHSPPWKSSSEGRLSFASEGMTMRDGGGAGWATTGSARPALSVSTARIGKSARRMRRSVSAVTSNLACHDSAGARGHRSGTRPFPGP